MSVLTANRVLLQTFTTATQAVAANAEQYKKDLTFLLTYSAQLKGYQLPQLHDSTTWPGGSKAYLETQSNWADMTGKLRGWSMSTLSSLTALPVALTNGGKQIIGPTLTIAVDTCGQLIERPRDAALRQSLMSDLHTLHTRFGYYGAITSPLLESLASQATVFDANSVAMSKIVDQVIKTSQADQGKINDLSSKIQQLNNDITANAWTIGIGSFIGLAGIGIGILGLVLAPFTGGVSLALLIPAVAITAGGAVCIGLGAANIARDKAAIEECNKSIDLYNADIVLLNTMAKTLGGFAGQVGQLKSAVATIAQPWQSAQIYFGRTVETIEQIENATSDDWQHAKTDLESVQVQWNDLMTTMEKLTIDTQVSTAQLSVGMDQSQVQRAMNGAPKLSLADYLAS